jgi:hypothetical protein
VTRALTHDEAVRRWGADPGRWPAWECIGCGQRNSGFVLVCGRCLQPRHAGDDEPRFTIRAQDALAPLAVEAWAAFAELAGKATGVDHLAAQADEAREIARAMRDWQATNPERVKWPD